jgi:ubiquinone/menaquinone biosynthesis C-methylase UbiE
VPAPGTTTPAASVDYPAITAYHRAAWVAGDGARIGSLGTIHGELLCEALDIHPGERVLDVAAGNGAAAVAAARRWADVVATDLVDHVLDSARLIAEAFGLSVRTQVADAQDLPFEDDSFDVVMSAFGSMFAPDQQAVADEAIRVCRPCGRIGLATWTPASLMGDVFRVTERRVPLARGLRGAADWGTEERIRELFGNRINSVRIATLQFTFRYRSPRHMLEYFRTWDGPTRAAFEALDAGGQDGLAADLLDVYATYNRATDGTLVAPSEYLETVATVR